MEISQLGEFGLIRHLTEKINLKNSSTVKGAGDDAAVLDYGTKKTLVTTDLLLEGIHFDLTYVPLKHLGYKAAVVNFMQAMAQEWDGVKIRINVINPERTKTPLRTKNFGIESEDTLLPVEKVSEISLRTLLSNFTGEVIDVKIDESD
jgi:hypothetical protein